MLKQFIFLAFVATTSLFFSCSKKSVTFGTETTIEPIYQEDSIPVNDVVADTLAPVDSIAIAAPDTVAVFKKKDTLTIIGVGDIMTGTNYPSASYLPPNNGKDLLKPVEDILKNADLTFGNLEGTVLNEGGTPKHCSNPNACYVFRMPESHIENLVSCGFDVMSIANNHSGDMGAAGRKKTVEVLKAAGIETAGLLTLPYTIFTIDSITYGFAAFAPNTGTVSINDLENAKSIVKNLDTLSDVVIVSFHGGAEGSKHQHVTKKTEIYYNENRGNVHKFAHTMVDAGADIIFGHGPHVTRAVEVYNDRFIAYSLGNFCTYARFNLRGVNGVAPIIKVFTNNSGKFIKAEVTSVVQLGEGGPVVDDQKRALNLIRELTKTDLPEAKILISEDGIITVE